MMQGLVEAAVELDNDLAGAVVVDLFKFTDITYLNGLVVAID